MNLQSVVVRPYGPGDEGEIARMFRETMDWPGFDHRGDEVDFWRWRYRKNPVGVASESIVARDGAVISHAASLPTLIKVRGAVMLASQLSDLYTRPEHRGKRLIEQALAVVEQQDRERGIEFEFAFPSAAGYELTMKTGFIEMPVRMAQYEMIVNPERFFRKVRLGTVKRVAYGSMMLLKGRGKAGIQDTTVDTVDAFPADIMEVVDRFEGLFSFVFHRSPAYLQWRYADQDAGTFRILVASREGSSCGYLVLRPYQKDDQSYMDIVDLIVMPDDVSTIRSLIDTALELCRQNDVDVIQAWLPTSHPFLPELGRMGFFLRQPTNGERWMTIVCRPMSENARAQLAEGEMGYHLVLGDTDWV